MKKEWFPEEKRGQLSEKNEIDGAEEENNKHALLKKNYTYFS